eukprot:c20713_g2_i1.p1 GENE.c20713_g2_i1~~c20713_g2_i1.p1  ORF type:complete len:223 (+),score=20.29 c20713_g2_i1:405-1073(+)
MTRCKDGVVAHILIEQSQNNRASEQKVINVLGVYLKLCGEEGQRGGEKTTTSKPTEREIHAENVNSKHQSFSGPERCPVSKSPTTQTPPEILVGASSHTHGQLLPRVNVTCQSNYLMLSSGNRAQGREYLVTVLHVTQGTKLGGQMIGDGTQVTQIPINFLTQLRCGQHPHTGLLIALCWNDWCNINTCPGRFQCTVQTEVSSIGSVQGTLDPIHSKSFSTF